MDDLTGQTIGQYRLIRKLGVGGMAEVYQAYQPRLDRYVALKFIRPELAIESNFRARFEQEARAIAKLSHGNVVHIYDFGEDNHRYYLVMEYVEGETLKERLQKLEKADKWVLFSEVVQIIKQIASALEYAHRQGIVHRDVKPDNVLLTSNGRAVLNDFGIAKMIEEGDGMTQTGAAIGTPAYMSPEQIQGQKTKLGPATDLYSLGVILYELLTGQTPFTADTAFAVMLKHINDPIPLPHQLNSGISADVERVLLKLLAKEPTDRFQSAADFVQALDRAIAAGGNVEVIHPSGILVDEDQTRVDPSQLGPTVADQGGSTAVAPAAPTMAGVAPTVVSLRTAAAEVEPAVTPATPPAVPVTGKRPWWVWAAVAAVGVAILLLGLRFLGSRGVLPGLPPNALITFSSQGSVFRVAPVASAIPDNISAHLNELDGDAGEDYGLNISPNGAWFLFNTTRGNSECAGWACLAVAQNQADLSLPETVYLEGWQVVHPDSVSAISPDGDIIVYAAEGDEHALDLWAIERLDDEFWSEPWLLTGASPFDWNELPAFDSDGEFIVFNCTDEQYGEVEGYICEVSIDEEEVEVLFGPDDGPIAYPEGENTLRNADYAPNGIVFTATWNNSSIWFWDDNEDVPEPLGGAQQRLDGHFLGCVLPDGRLVTLEWNETLQGPNLVVTNRDGSNSFVIDTPAAVDYGSVGCGG